MAMATLRISMVSFISIWALPPAQNIELYQDGPWTLAQKQGTALGKIRGPRIWMSGRAIGGVSTGHDAFGSRTARDNIIVTTAEEVRRAVQRKKELGCEILKVNEFLSMDLVK